MDIRWGLRSKTLAISDGLAMLARFIRLDIFARGMGLEWPEILAQCAQLARQVMTERDLTQTAFGDLVGLAQAQVSRLVNEKEEKLDVMVLVRVIEVAGKSLTEFFTVLEGHRPSTGMRLVAPDPSKLAAANVAARTDRQIAKTARELVRLAQTQARKSR
jgi:transcriptional regulator with XRE-family HTH domain